MITRVKQILENYIEYNAEVDIKDIKEITKKKDITKIKFYINNLMYEKINYHNRHKISCYVYNNIYIILYIYFVYIYDKKNNCLIRYMNIYNSDHYKYCYENNNIIRKYYIYNILVYISIFKNHLLKYRYDYYNKIKNDKYKSNYRLLYICFV
jgi:hypothetical protein